MQTDELENLMDELSNWRRLNADKAGTPKFREVNLAHRELTRYFESYRSVTALAHLLVELKKIDDGTHPDCMK